MSEAKLKGINELRVVYLSLSQNEKCSSIVWCRWKKLACLVLQASSLEAEKMCLQPSPLVCPVPGIYIGCHYNWHLWLYVWQWKAPTIIQKPRLCAQGLNELLVRVSGRHIQCHKYNPHSCHKQWGACWGAPIDMELYLIHQWTWNHD